MSVIVPVYKVEAYLDQCISSITNQTYRNLEIILVDDGSPDNCPGICDEWKERDSRIKVIHKPNGGLSDARNAGMKLSRGKWLLFIDADDVIPVHFVSALVSAATSDDCLVVSGNTRFLSDTPQYKILDNVPVPCGKNIAGKRGGLYCWGALYSRELVNSLELQFDTSLRNIEDVVWNAIYLRYIAEVVYVDVPYFYRMNPKSITSKCGDCKWQIASWVAARRSIMNWFAEKTLTASQRKEVAGMFRHCQNNIYAECVAGKISYATLKELENQDDAQFHKLMVNAPERFFRKHFPKLYFETYVSLICLKSAIHR